MSVFATSWSTGVMSPPSRATAIAMFTWGGRREGVRNLFCRLCTSPREVQTTGNARGVGTNLLVVGNGGPISGERREEERVLGEGITNSLWKENA